MRPVVSLNFFLPLIFLSFEFYIHQGASIKSLEAGSNGHVAAVKLGDGSTVEADTVIIYLYTLISGCNLFLVKFHF